MEYQLKQNNGVQVRTYMPIGLERKMQRRISNHKLSNRRLDLVASDHRLPRIVLDKTKWQRSNSTVNLETRDAHYHYKKTKMSNWTKSCIPSSENGLFRSFSVPDILSELESEEQLSQEDNGNVKTLCKEIHNCVTDKKKSSGHILFNFDEEDPEIECLMSGREENQSLGQTERELGLYEIAPSQIWKKNKISRHIVH